MIDAELRYLNSISVPDGAIEKFVPDDPTYFGLQVTAGIGPKDETGPDGEEAVDWFYFFACSPRWFQDNALEAQYAWGRPYLFLSRFDPAAIRQAILDVCNAASGPDWESVASKIGRYIHWEFEDDDR